MINDKILPQSNYRFAYSSWRDLDDCLGAFVCRLDQMAQNITIKKLEEKDCRIIADAFAEQNWDKPLEQYQNYLIEQEKGERTVLVAKIDEEFAGYLTICWKADYQPFQEKQIPEIVDFNVLIKFRKRGIGMLLMDAAETLVAEKSDMVGIGVGLYSDYGNAQRLYYKRGYIPDGLGISQDNYFPKYGDKITVDDGLALHFTKTLN